MKILYTTRHGGKIDWNNLRPTAAEAREDGDGPVVKIECRPVAVTPSKERASKRKP